MGFYKRSLHRQGNLLAFSGQSASNDELSTLKQREQKLASALDPLKYSLIKELQLSQALCDKQYLNTLTSLLVEQAGLQSRIVLLSQRRASSFFNTKIWTADTILRCLTIGLTVASKLLHCSDCY